MNKKIERVLSGKNENYIFPFFWQHGEEEAVLRRYMGAIHGAGIGAVCVESRPHPAFCKTKWWEDMDVILDEARKRNMKVWILDDSHFPTGYCSGALVNGPDELRRQSLVCRMLCEAKEGEVWTFEASPDELVPPFQKTPVEEYAIKQELKTFTDDVLLGVAAVRVGGSDIKDLKCLTEQECRGWRVPKGHWRLYACSLTRNRGPHRDYINMMDEEACHKLIETVYEPHYRHYKEDFGTTIAGFFSDEPELGNGHLYDRPKRVHEMEDQPWSREVQAELKNRWGENWVAFLPLLWDEEFNRQLSAKIRYDFMDTVTRLVEKDFSWQVGDWCRAHGVEYIGHMIEDNNHHSRSGSSLGHYFRGLAGQDMSGIDDIGGQVLPQGEDLDKRFFMGGKRDGEFFHYMLGRLASSAAAIDPQKKGRAMCEIFGNYGWQEGVALEKYLADHFMVRGINRFVPHAFSAKPFPDPDCPPHFYADGNDPQYRHFGKLMDYMNRICELISGGVHHSPAAILYHGDADWAGGTCMFGQVPARLLADRQIEYDFIPSDVFTDARYGTRVGNPLRINGQEYRVLIVPECSFVTAEFAKTAAELLKTGLPVIFLNRLPQGICSQERPLREGLDKAADERLLRGLSSAVVLPVEQLVSYLDKLGLAEIRLEPANDRIRCLHYQNDADFYYLVNEGAECWHGEIRILNPAFSPDGALCGRQNYSCYIYDAWENRLEQAAAAEDSLKFHVCIEPRKSVILVLDAQAGEDKIKSLPVAGRLLEELENGKTDWSKGWRRSVCTALEYPAFHDEKNVELPDYPEKEWENFGGLVRYEKELTYAGDGAVFLEITDAAEGVEVFVNGISAGIQIVPAFRYELTPLLNPGKNEIAIEVATTLERVVPYKPKRAGEEPRLPSNRCGISGKVYLKIR